MQQFIDLADQIKEWIESDINLECEYNVFEIGCTCLTIFTNSRTWFVLEIAEFEKDTAYFHTYPTSEKVLKLKLLENGAWQMLSKDDVELDAKWNKEDFMMEFWNLLKISITESKNKE